jgi:hypothetical protein
MAFSRAFLGAAYTPAQYAGAGLVGAGILVVLSPQLVGTAPPSENGHSQVARAVRTVTPRSRAPLGRNGRD